MTKSALLVLSVGFIQGLRLLRRQFAFFSRLAKWAEVWYWHFGLASFLY